MNLSLSSPGSKLKTLDKNENKSDWQKSQELQNYKNPHLFLQATVVQNPWQQIRQYEATTLQNQIQPLQYLQQQGFRYDNTIGRKKQRNNIFKDYKAAKQTNLFKQQKDASK